MSVEEECIDAVYCTGLCFNSNSGLLTVFQFEQRWRVRKLRRIARHFGRHCTLGEATVHLRRGGMHPLEHVNRSSKRLKHAGPRDVIDLVARPPPFS